MQVAAVQRCNCLMSDLALFQTKLRSRGESLVSCLAFVLLCSPAHLSLLEYHLVLWFMQASAKHQLLRMGTLLLQYKRAWVRLGAQ